MANINDIAQGNYRDKVISEPLNERELKKWERDKMRFMLELSAAADADANDLPDLSYGKHGEINSKDRNIYGINYYNDNNDKTHKSKAVDKLREERDRAAAVWILQL